jgi:hypothetical protein
MFARRKSLRSVAIGGIASILLIAGMPAGAAGAAREGHKDTGGKAREQAVAAVLDWSAIAEAALAEGRGPGPSQYLMAAVEVAIYDTVVAMEGGSQPYAVTAEVRHPVSPAAAIATAAHGVLVARAPGQATVVGEQFREYLDEIKSRRAKLNGIHLGVQVADAIIELRSSDGFGKSVPYVQPPPGPGVFEPVAPTPPIGTEHGQLAPYAMSAPDQFRPDGPDPLGSAEYAQDFLEVKDLGRADSEQRTDEQTETALFWSDHGFLQLSRMLRGIAGAQNLDARETARMLAMAHVAGADAGVGCFDAKYHYMFWRPTHAIPRADTDGNDATTPDATWEPLLNSNHPEYPAGAACANSAIFGTLASFFGTDDVAFDVDSTVTETTRHYESFSDALLEDLDARVWSGLHFRNAVEEGADLGQNVADLVSNTLFQEI